MGAEQRQLARRGCGQNGTGGRVACAPSADSSVGRYARRPRSRVKAAGARRRRPAWARSTVAALCAGPVASPPARARASSDVPSVLVHFQGGCGRAAAVHLPRCRLADGVARGGHRPRGAARKQARRGALPERDGNEPAERKSVTVDATDGDERSTAASRTGVWREEGRSGARACAPACRLPAGRAASAAERQTEGGCGGGRRRGKSGGGVEGREEEVVKTELKAGRVSGVRAGRGVRTGRMPSRTDREPGDARQR